MAKYKVSYKILREQSEELKTVAKLLDGYTEQVEQIRGRLGQDEMLSSVCDNLQKLCTQLGESRAIINMAGEVLSNSVEDYNTLETRQVKKVDALKAHNRDFYKNPVVVASVGSTAGASAAGATTINYTENNTYINTTPNTSGMESTVTSTPVAAVSAPDAEESAASGMSGLEVGILGAAVGATAGAGGACAAGHMKKRLKERKVAEDEKNELLLEDDPESRLALAIERVKRLREEENR